MQIKMKNYGKMQMHLHISFFCSTFAATLYYAKEDANEKDTKYD